MQSWIFPVYFLPMKFQQSSIIPLYQQAQNGNKEEEMKKNSISEKKQNYEDIFRNLIQQKYCKPSKKKWSEDEDNLLIDLRQKQMPWKEISQHFHNSNPRICKRRHQRILNCLNKWPKDLDIMIVRLYQKENIKKWNEIQKIIQKQMPKFKSYSSKKLKQRYTYFLQKGISYKQWKIDEDLKLLRLISQYGRRWKLLTQYFPNRTQLQLKNRYKGTLKFLEQKAITRSQFMNNKEAQI